MYKIESKILDWDLIYVKQWVKIMGEKHIEWLTNEEIFWNCDDVTIATTQE